MGRFSSSTIEITRIKCHDGVVSLSGNSLIEHAGGMRSLVVTYHVPIAGVCVTKRLHTFSACIVDLTMGCLQTAHLVRGGHGKIHLDFSTAQRRDSDCCLHDIRIGLRVGRFIWGGGMDKAWEKLLRPEAAIETESKFVSGQFFTPREIVRFAIDVISPQYKKSEIILDTALKDYADKYIFGCDIDPLLYRISKSYMGIVGDGKSDIYNFDSLEPYHGFNERFRKRIKPGSVDLIPTNPPFGAQEDSVEFRKWLMRKVQITAVVDLPREAFQPHTGTKTSLVF